jgi:hypothetical protein
VRPLPLAQDRRWGWWLWERCEGSVRQPGASVRDREGEDSTGCAPRIARERKSSCRQNGAGGVRLVRFQPRMLTSLDQLSCALIDAGPLNSAAGCSDSGCQPGGTRQGYELRGQNGKAGCQFGLGAAPFTCIPGVPPWT